jgi:hypothetical protein
VYGAAAVAAVGIAFIATPEVAFAEVDLSAVTTTPAIAATDPTTTTSTGLPVLVPGTPGSTAPVAATSSQAPGDGTTTTTQGGSLDLEGLADSAGASEGDEPEVPDDPSDDEPLIDPGDDPSSSAQTTSATATSTQTDPGNGNATVRVDDPGNGGSVSQTNGASAAAQSDSAGTPPSAAAGNQTSTGSASASTTEASAAAAQTGASNANVAVRVGSEGDVGPTTQTNNVEAAAAATGTGTATGNASASASQTSPHNVNVVVRVDSPGNNGAVTQTNNASATAGATLPAPASSGNAGGNGPFGTDQQTSATSGTYNLNENQLGQQIEQNQGGQAPGTLPGAAGSQQTATPSTIGSASASQTGALNVNVSVRVGSPGADGPVKQSNTANATGTSPALGLVSQTGGSNINVSLTIPGLGPVAVGTDWLWNWMWDGTWTLPPILTGDVAPTSDAIWNWLWTAGATSATPTANAGTSTTGAAKTGTWSWSWDWILPDGSTWSFDWVEACACNWTWDWSWDWSKGAPASTPVDASVASDSEEAAVEEYDPATDDGPVEQTNSVSAGAFAITELITTSELDQSQTGSDPTLELQDAWALQRIVNAQTAAADAQAVQTAPWNVNFVWGAPFESVRQTNEVEADAVAEAFVEVSQYIVQDQDGNDETQQWVDAEQWVGTSQTALASAQSVQTGVVNSNTVAAQRTNQARVGAVEQSNTVDTLAYATIDAIIEQWIGQFEIGGVAIGQVASATQYHLNAQTATVIAQATQSLARNVHEVVVPRRNGDTVPSIRQRNSASSEAFTWNTNGIDAWILQALGGATDVEIADASQEGKVKQTGSASAAATNDEVLNFHRWVGVEPPEDPVPDVTEQAVPIVVVTGTVTTAITSTLRPGISTSSTHTTKTDRRGPHTSTYETLTFWSGDDDRPARGSAAFGPGPGSDASTPSSSTPWSNDSNPGFSPSAASPNTSPQPSELREHPRAERSPRSSFLPVGEFSAGSGASGFAPLPGGGSGPIAAVLSPFKFAAPAQLGPQMPTPTLGRSAAFIEPFERPG